MPKLKKAILPEGEYLVNGPNGTKRLKTFDATYLSTVVANSNAMIKSGLKIPAPFQHLKEAIPTDQPEVSSYNNGGYWEKFELEIKDGKAVLNGVIDTPGSTDDPNTPAGKFTSTIKEVSACIKDNWVDGVGRGWGPCILHCAGVLHPVVPGQEGFSIMDDAIALSVLDMASTANLTNLSQLSKELEDAGLYIPPDTMLEELPKVLLTVLKQKKLCDDHNQDDPAIVETQSVWMSLPQGNDMKPKVTKSFAEQLVAMKALNPDTKNPYTLDDFDLQADPKDQYALALTRELTNQRQDDLRRRIKGLVETGRTTKEYAEGSLLPMIDKYELSLGEGASFVKSNVDIIVESMEALPVVTQPTGKVDPHALPSDATIHLSNLATEGSEAELTAEQAEAMKKELLSAM